MKVGIVYTSITGNTEEAMKIITQYMRRYTGSCYVYRVEHFPYYELDTYDAIIIGTYTWGNGDIPHEMMKLYRAFEDCSPKDIVTGVFGTGDQCYSQFCGAVDEFRDMLYVHSSLAATLKVELMPQRIDEHRFDRFVRIVMERVNSKQGITV
ncbi:flavodoxin domain-containing protein [Bacillus sp. REN16]|uniref:flavodoxin domain-containing protein n=1 Tax=Bacillus sp. REN16 TaxID=2887296 RepID=UPI001E3FB68C|nr:flavodoxin domain-containing protein [Bacillus sp. REN16]MCC3355526.1 flavodoxin domain-containing protein [Bacillus sp. REN16]